MSLLPPSETNSLERELTFLKQTISSLRDQLERNMDLHDSELHAIEEGHAAKESNFQKLVAGMREDYEKLSLKNEEDKQRLKSTFEVERKSFSSSCLRESFS